MLTSWLKADVIVISWISSHMQTTAISSAEVESLYSQYVDSLRDLKTSTHPDEKAFNLQRLQELQEQATSLQERLAEPSSKLLYVLLRPAAEMAVLDKWC